MGIEEHMGVNDGHHLIAQFVFALFSLHFFLFLVCMRKEGVFLVGMKKERVLSQFMCMN